MELGAPHDVRAMTTRRRKSGQDKEGEVEGENQESPVDLARRPGRMRTYSFGNSCSLGTTNPIAIPCSACSDTVGDGQFLVIHIILINYAGLSTLSSQFLG